MWLQRFSSYLVVCGFMLLVLVVGALFLNIGLPFLSFGSAVLGICLIFFLPIICFWPIIGAVVSWKSIGLVHQPETKAYYTGLVWLCIIYGLGIVGCLNRYSPLGYWIFFGNSLGLLLRSVFIEWRVAEGRARRLSINLLLALVLPLIASLIFLFPQIRA